MSRPGRRVAFLVSHLSGTGHLVRTLALAEAVREAGGQPLVISGGRPLAHVASAVALVQVPPLSVPDFDYSRPRDGRGRVADAAYLAERRARIVGTITDFAPEVLVTETYPLGRRRQAQEYGAAIEAAGPAAVLASVRDVPEPPSKPVRIAEAAERLRARYGGVLVHGDADFLALDETWPLPADVAAMVQHTGYVGAPAIVEAQPGPTVLVSGGGGPAAAPLLALAAAAAALSPRPWHLLGPAPERPLAPNVVAEPPRPDYRGLLAQAAVSVSLAGYNTAMDLAACTTPALLVPFEDHGQREQAIRAERLARFPGIAVARFADLDAEALAHRVERLARGPRRQPLPLARDGAARTAALILEAAG